MPISIPILSAITFYVSAAIGTAVATADHASADKRGEMFLYGVVFMPIVLTMLTFNKLTKYLLN